MVVFDSQRNEEGWVKNRSEPFVNDDNIHWCRFKRKQAQSSFHTISLAQMNASGRDPKVKKDMNNAECL